MDFLVGIDTSALIYVGVFMGVLIAFEGLRQMVSRSESHDAARSRRLKRLGNRSPEEVLALLRSPRNLSWWQRLPLLGRLPQSLRQGGMEISTPAVFAGVFLLIAAIYIVASQFFPVVLSAGAALALGVLVPVAVADGLRARRTARLVSQLPDALDLMARGLRVGHPLNTTIATVAKDMPQPIAEEFAHVADQISYGEDLPDALADLAERIQQEDFIYLSAAIRIQHGSGGNLGRVLATLSKVIRARAALRRKIIAISSEGRLSALILSLLPVVIFGMTSLMTPSYYGDVSDDPLFMPIAAIVVTLVVVNFFTLRKLVNFKV